MLCRDVQIKGGCQDMFEKIHQGDLKYVGENILVNRE